MDFALNNYAQDPFPRAIASNAAQLRWKNEDWDPALRFWALEFDPKLTEWLKWQDASLASTMAAREFANEHKKWRVTDDNELMQRGWLDKQADLAWLLDIPATTTPAEAIKAEIAQLFDMMEDDRNRYLSEIDGQADGLAAYVVSFLGIDGERKPHTIELIRCGLAIGNITYMNYKELFRRVRPSTICPGLVPPFGPPRHPSFPSGHSFLGHFIGLLLLEIPEVASIFGELSLPPPAGQAIAVRGKVTIGDVMSSTVVFEGPLLWLGDRLAKNRERAGLHYPSDSSAGRHLAGAIWALLVNSPPAGTSLTTKVPLAKPPGAVGDVTVADLVRCPTLDKTLRLAKAEWAS